MGFFEMMMEEEEEDDEELYLLSYAAAMASQAEPPRRRRRALDAPPRRIVPRDREEGDSIIRRQYFAPNPIYNDEVFRRRFRMPKCMFLRIHDALASRYEYFQHRPDATGRYGLTGLQKCVGSIRMLAYGQPYDILDEYVRIGESTLRESVHRFCKGIIEIFGPKYLRTPTADDVETILAFNKARGFPGMLGSIDCMHWRWKNCPAAYKGYYTGRGKHPTMILEAIATHDLWIWHAYFGLPGSLNDINVLHHSPVFHNFLHGAAPKVKYQVNGNDYDVPYYLADGIYPDWPAFVKSPRKCHDARSEKFKERQEAERKQIERAFGVLQSRWGVVRGPAYAWDPDCLSDMLTACIIMHNMIIETEGRELHELNVFDEGSVPFVTPADLEHTSDTQSFVQSRHRLTDRSKHKILHQDLIQHMWNHVGASAQHNHDA